MVDVPQLQAVLAAANRSKQRSVQAHAGELVQAIADRRGWTPEQLADRTVPTGGLDADGTLDLDCGRDRTYELRLGADETLGLFNPDGKEVKALPAPRIDDEKPLIDAAKKKMSAARKEVKQVVAAQTERLKEAMCLERQWPVEDWSTFVVGHPLVGRATAVEPEQLDRLAHDLPDRLPRVERAVRVLEHVLDLPARLAAATPRARRQLDVAEQHAPGALGVHAGDRPGQGRLARAGLADERQALAGAEL